MSWNACTSLLLLLLLLLLLFLIIIIIIIIITISVMFGQEKKRELYAFQQS